jgi:hypothetical protein
MCVPFGFSFVFVLDLSYGFPRCLIFVLLAVIGFGLVHGWVSLVVSRSPVGWVNLSPKETPKVAGWRSPGAEFLLC